MVEDPKIDMREYNEITTRMLEAEIALQKAVIARREWVRARYREGWTYGQIAKAMKVTSARAQQLAHAEDSPYLRHGGRLGKVIPDGVVAQVDRAPDPPADTGYLTVTTSSWT